MAFDRQRSGTRVYDINHDGVAHYGLYPDWIEDARKVAGSEGETLMQEMGRGAEAYLQIAPRPISRCGSAHGRRRRVSGLAFARVSAAFQRSPSAIDASNRRERDGVAGAGGLGLLLLIPSIPLSQHQCFGFIGFLAHSPLYAFLALTAGLLAVGLVFALRRLALAFGVGP